MNSFIFTIFGAVVLIMSVVIHEVSHGLMAQSLGDNTAKNAGRLTLNPIKHIDLFGSIILPIFLLLISGGGFVFGYAKPVPYNPLNLRDKKYGPAKVGFAGPMANIILALLFGLSFRFLSGVLYSLNISQLFYYVVWINLALAIFNLIPVPPLDGHWLLMTFLPERLNGLKVFLYRYSIILFLAVLFFVVPWLSLAVNFLVRLITGI